MILLIVNLGTTCLSSKTQYSFQGCGAANTGSSEKNSCAPSSNLVNILSNADIQERPTADFKCVSLSRRRDSRRPRRDGLHYLGAVRDRDTLRTKNGSSVCSLEALLNSTELVLNSTGLDGVVVKITPSRRQLLDRRVAVCANGELALSHVFIADFAGSCTPLRARWLT